jgi:ABC-type lipoprotein release transport system permease subunit
MIRILAWRNIWRNRLRSIIITAAVSLGIFAGIFIIAFSNGAVNSRIEAVVSTEISHIQIHKFGFLDNNEFSLRFTVSDSLMKKLTATPHIAAISKHIIINSMVSSAETGTGVKITGIDPAQEMKVSNLHTKIIKGEYPGEAGRNPVIISERLASKLKAGLHGKIVLTMQDKSGDITGGAFRIAGIYRTDNMIFDDVNIFVRNSDLARMTGIGVNEAHEIALLLDDNDNTASVSSALSASLPGFDVKNWLQLSPDAGALVGAMNQYTYIFTIIILLALSFGIVNTMLMAIMERRHELGMLMAVGMNRIRIFTMVMLETLYLSLTGGVIGILGGWAVSVYLGKTGINLFFWKEAFGELGFSSLIYPAADTRVIILTAVMVIVSGILSAIYPALKAVSFNPSQAIRSI